MGGPSMQISQNFAIENKGKGLHVKVSPFDGRCIVKHEENAGDGEDDEEETGDPSETERITEFETVSLHLRREDMEEEVIVDQQRPFEIGVRYSSPEDGTPDDRLCNVLKDSFFHRPLSTFAA